MKAVVFDIDGTLVDSVDLHARAWQDALRHFGRDVEFGHIRSQIGKGGDQILPVFFSKQEIERFGEDVTKLRMRIYQRDYAPRVRPFPNVRELFERLARDGKKIALASSAVRQDLEHNLELLNIKDLVDASTSADDAGRSKPDPDIFEAALARLDGIGPEESVAVGDTPYDAEAAAKIHLRPIGVLCGGFPESHLRQAGCIAIYKDPADLLAHYCESPLAA